MEYQLLDLQYTGKGPQGSFLSDMSFLASGSEHDVFKRGNSVYKIAEPYNDKSDANFKKRIDNALDISRTLGDGQLQVVGFYNSANGTKNPVFQQPLYKGRSATPEEIASYMKRKGFFVEQAAVSSSASPTFSKIENGEKLTVKDLDGDNVKIGKNGKIYVLDASLARTPVKSLGGKAGLAAALLGGAGAASAGDYRRVAAELAESVLPLGLTPSTLAPGTLTPEQRAASDEAYRAKLAKERESKARAQALLRSGVPMPEEYRHGGRVRMI